MYLEILLADFAVFRVFLGISRDFAEIPKFRGSATPRNIRSPDLVVKFLCLLQRQPGKAFCSQLTRVWLRSLGGTGGEPVNSARYSLIEQPIRACEKHYLLFQYILKSLMFCSPINEINTIGKVRETILPQNTYSERVIKGKGYRPWMW